MATTNPKKPALHGAAAESHAKAEAGKAEAKPANEKPNDTGRAPIASANKNGSGKKSR